MSQANGASVIDRLRSLLALGQSDAEEHDPALKNAALALLEQYLTELEKVAGIGFSDWNASEWLQVAAGTVPVIEAFRIGSLSVPVGNQSLTVPVGLPAAAGRLLLVKHRPDQRKTALALTNAIALRQIATTPDGRIEVSFVDPIGGGDSPGLLNPEDAPSIQGAFRGVIAASALITRRLQVVQAAIERSDFTIRRVVVSYDFPAGFTTEGLGLWRAMASSDAGVFLVATVSTDSPIQLQDYPQVDMVDLSSGNVSVLGLALPALGFSPDAIPLGTLFTSIQEQIGLRWRSASSTASFTLALPDLPSKAPEAKASRPPETPSSQSKSAPPIFKTSVKPPPPKPGVTPVPIAPSNAHASRAHVLVPEQTSNKAWRPLGVIIGMMIIIGIIASGNNQPRTEGTVDTGASMAPAPAIETPSLPAVLYGHKSSKLPVTAREGSSNSDLADSGAKPCPSERVCVYAAPSSDVRHRDVQSGSSIAGWSSSQAGWYRIQLADGSLGFIRSKDLARLTLPPTIDEDSVILP